MQPAVSFAASDASHLHGDSAAAGGDDGVAKTWRRTDDVHSADVDTDAAAMGASVAADDDADDDALSAAEIATNRQLLQACLSLHPGDVRRLIEIEQADAWWQDPCPPRQFAAAEQGGGWRRGDGPLHCVFRGYFAQLQLCSAPGSASQAIGGVGGVGGGVDVVQEAADADASADAELERRAAEVLEILLTNGAVWNQYNAVAHLTPGCLFWHLHPSPSSSPSPSNPAPAAAPAAAASGSSSASGSGSGPGPGPSKATAPSTSAGGDATTIKGYRLYEMVVDTGVRAEVLLRALGGGGSEFGVDGSDGPEEGAAATAADDDDGMQEEEEKKRKPDYAAEYLSGGVQYTHPITGDSVTETLLDDAGNAVMMSWESGIMSRSASLIGAAPRHPPEVGAGPAVLNIGFGLGLIDAQLQAQPTPPRRHIIVEAHPTVLARMRHDGWFERPNVVVLQGRWQDNIEQIAIAAGEELLDGVYYDPFGEDFDDFLHFVDQVVVPFLRPPSAQALPPSLLSGSESRSGAEQDQGGIFSFFNGFGADRRVVYDVYAKVTQIELCEFGLEVSYEDMPAVAAKPAAADAADDDDDNEEAGKTGEVRDEWRGARRKYWDHDGPYRLPTVRFAPLGQ